eukprot:NODE_187_length_15673_cov_0.222743.p2 type:complete len:448 gc:universal NODE_187_length_15673_cov_0.222743:8234-6891(-)
MKALNNSFLFPMLLPETLPMSRNNTKEKEKIISILQFRKESKQYDTVESAKDLLKFNIEEAIDWNKFEQLNLLRQNMHGIDNLKCSKLVEGFQEILEAQTNPEQWKDEIDFTDFSERYSICFPDNMPKCFNSPVIKTKSMENENYYAVIRLYKGKLTYLDELLCVIVHPSHMEDLANSFKSHYLRISSRLHIASSLRFGIYSIPRIPDVFAPNSNHFKIKDSSDAIIYSLEKLPESNRYKLLYFMINLHDQLSSSWTCFVFNIQSFYSSIYSHAISWTLFRKALQLQNIGESFEKAIRGMKGNESHGIGCGPFASHDTADLFLSLIDTEIADEFKELLQEKDMKIIRKLDTFIVQGISSVMQNILTIRNRISKVLSRYQLNLNYHKQATIKDISEIYSIVLLKELGVSDVRYDQSVIEDRIVGRSVDLEQWVRKFKTDCPFDSDWSF